MNFAKYLKGKLDISTEKKRVFYSLDPYNGVWLKSPFHLLQMYKKM